MMRWSLAAFAALVSLFSPAILARASGDTTGTPIPERVDAPAGSSEPPVWVSLAEVAPDGVLRKGVLSESAFSSLEREIQRLRQLPPPQPEAKPTLTGQAPGPSCKSWARTFVDWVGEAPAENLEGLAQQSAAVVHGAVVDAKQGFFHEQLGTLLAIETRDLLKQPEGLELPFTFLVFVHDAQVRVSGEWLCRGQENWPARPVVGAEALLFLQPSLIKATPGILVPDPDSLWFEADGKLVTPTRFKPQLSGLGSLSLRGLTRAVARFVAQRSEEP